MPTSTEVITARETLIISIEPGERNLIDRAAEEALYDQVIIKADPEAYGKFLERIVEKPRPNVRLLKTMAISPPWEEE